ncbi:MAG: hypothetical protein AAGB12_01555 [Pseudomonadota bacterium]
MLRSSEPMKQQKKQLLWLIFLGGVLFALLPDSLSDWKQLIICTSFGVMGAFWILLKSLKNQAQLHNEREMATSKPSSEIDTGTES